jgi:hypothetical protein
MRRTNWCIRRRNLGITRPAARQIVFVQVTIPVASIGHLFSVLTGQPSALPLLGAGASVKSGIPLAAGVIEKAAKWAYAREHGRAPNDPRLQRSDWLPWLREKRWYDASKPPSDNYPTTVENLLQPRQARADFFADLLNPGVDASPGYARLLDFMHWGLVRWTLTTNFDACLPEARIRLRRPHYLDLIETTSDYIKLSTSPQHPQLVYLHGSVRHYTDRNIVDEVQRLDGKLVPMLVPLLRDHPLIVVGYRGAEPSIMNHLLLEHAEAADYYRHGIYWCMLKSERVDDLAPPVHDLARTIGKNFQIVPIDGFDELMEELWARYQGAQPARPTPADASPPTESPTLDMAPASGVGIEDLELATVRSRIVQYCERLDIRVPQPVERAWVLEQLIRQNLAVRERDGSVRPTIAGYLLFGREPQRTMGNAQVVLRAKGSHEWITAAIGDKPGNAPAGSNSGDTERTIDGNLWAQYDAINDALTAFNRPFRLKGGISETVFPYPPLALKEIIVNALVHRAYERNAPIVIEVEPSRIHVINPGGLVDEVRQRVGTDSIEGEIRKGRRGIKGYRNPVIADLFYGSGDMDKAGSGLSDVYKSVHENGGDVRFGPTAENDAFEAVIYSRPEAVDEITGTASPLVVTSTRYSANLLEVVELPEVVWHGGTDAGTVRTVWAASKANWLPPFIVAERRIFTFHDLSVTPDVFGEAIDSGDVEPMRLEEFTTGPDGGRRLVQLLNRCVQQHLDIGGMIVDRRRWRAHFPRTEEGARQISYQARVRRATRTIVKPRTRPSTGKISYWEHDAFSFRFERFGEAWALMIEPGYVFTWNGIRGQLAPERVTRLSTRRASQDYNATVLSDLYFWTWVLSGGQDGSFTLKVGPRRVPRPNPGERSVATADSGRRGDESATPEPMGAARVVISARLPSIVVNDVAFAESAEPGAPEEDASGEFDEELAGLAEQRRKEVEG